MTGIQITQTAAEAAAENPAKTLQALVDPFGSGAFDEPGLSPYQSTYLDSSRVPRIHSLLARKLSHPANHPLASPASLPVYSLGQLQSGEEAQTPTAVLASALHTQLQSEAQASTASSAAAGASLNGGAKPAAAVTSPFGMRTVAPPRTGSNTSQTVSTMTPMKGSQASTSSSIPRSPAAGATQQAFYNGRSLVASWLKRHLSGDAVAAEFLLVRCWLHHLKIVVILFNVADLTCCLSCNEHTRHIACPERTSVSVAWHLEISL